MVHQACVDWEIPIETENAAAVVVSELATNAVVHAETPLRAGVELSGEVLWIGVRDLRPDLPLRLFARSRKLVDSPDRAPRHFGLHVVSALARNWGVTEQPDAKTVWAQLPLPDAVTVEAGPLTSSSPIPPTTDRTAQGDRSASVRRNPVNVRGRRTRTSGGCTSKNDGVGVTA